MSTSKYVLFAIFTIFVDCCLSDGYYRFFGRIDWNEQNFEDECKYRGKHLASIRTLYQYNAVYKTCQVLLYNEHSNNF